VDVTLGEHDAARRLPGRATSAPSPFWVDEVSVEAMLEAFQRALTR
jgi:hypothetical protein